MSVDKPSFETHPVYFKLCQLRCLVECTGDALIAIKTSTLKDEADVQKDKKIESVQKIQKEALGNSEKNIKSYENYAKNLGSIKNPEDEELGVAREWWCEYISNKEYVEIFKEHRVLTFINE